jgi:hypothetical protein
MARMLRSIAIALLCWIPAAACATSAQPPSMVVAPTTPAASETAAGVASSPLQDRDPLAALDAGTTAAADDAGAPARFRACSADADCIAVPRVGCCHNGWKEAVAASQKDPYAASFVCPDPHPVCAMYLIRDAREAKCDPTTRLCTMTTK